MIHCAENYRDAVQQLEKLSLMSLEISTTQFSYKFELLSDLGCTQLFRFCRKDVMRMIPVMAWPEEKRKTSMNGYSVNPLLATCVVLRRLTTPDRWCDLECLFGKFSSQLAEIFRDGLNHFVRARSNLLTSVIPKAFIAGRSQAYASAVFEKSGCMDNCVAFIDGTVIGISRPGGGEIHQRVVYNGHKRKHALKFQAVTTPDGLCIHLHGPEVGRRHDMFLYASSGMDAQLLDVMTVNGKQFIVYGDSGYSWRVYLEVPFAGANLSAVQKAFNKAMSAVRISVEWYFKCVKQLWSFVDSKRKLRVRQMPVGLVYQAAVLLTNLHNCIQPNEISQYFACVPPSLEAYINERGEE